MSYRKNFAIRVIICVLGMLVVWMGVWYVLDVVICHEEFALRPVLIVVPVILGISEAYAWKSKDEKSAKALDK